MRLKYFVREVTQYLGDGIFEKTGRVWTAYVYDEEVGHHLCDLSPSYECHPVTTFTEKRVDDDLHADLQEHEPAYFYCYSVKEGRDIPSLPLRWDDQDDEEYLESALDWCRGNCGMFEVVP